MAPNGAKAKIGNTEQSSRIERKNWFFTFNNYLTHGYNGDMIFDILKKICTKFVFQEEIGDESKIIHLQGYINFSKKIRLSALKKLISDKIHWEIPRNNDACIEYCQKSETSTGKIWKFGFPKEIKIISELRPFQKDLIEICLNEPDDRSVIWVYDPIGNMGKTQFLKYMNVKYNAVFSYGGKKNDIINLVFNNKDYLLNYNNPIMIYSFPRDINNEHISYDSIEQIKDGCISNNKFECGCFCCNSPHVIVLANCLPNLNKLTMDRWILKTINNNFELIDYKDDSLDNI